MRVRRRDRSCVISRIDHSALNFYGQQACHIIPRNHYDFVFSQELHSPWLHSGLITTWPNIWGTLIRSKAAALTVFRMDFYWMSDYITCGITGGYLLILYNLCFTFSNSSITTESRFLYRGFINRLMMDGSFNLTTLRLTRHRHKLWCTSISSRPCWRIWRGPEKSLS